MTNKKIQTDYWNDGIKFAREENWKKAIECYENAVNKMPNPALYTNLASCYKNLNNLEKEKENYLLAIDGLLNKEYTYTNSPANSTAWYLFENNIELKKAEEIAKIAIEINNNSAAAMDTYIKILIKNKKIDEAIMQLAILKNKFPNFKASLELYKKYNKEIDKYIKNFFKEKDKENRVKEILSNKEFPKNKVDFIVKGIKTNLKEIFYPYDLRKIYNNLKDNFIDDNDDIMLRYFQVIFSMKEVYYKQELLNAITNYKKDIDSYMLAFNIVRNANISSVDFLVVIINDNLSSKNSSVLEFFKKNINNDKQLEAIILQIKNYSKKGDVGITRTLIELLLSLDYDKYIDRIIKIMVNTIYYYNVSYFIPLIKDGERVISFLIKKLENYNNAKNKFDIEFFDELRLFLENGEMSKGFIEQCNNIELTYHYNNFYSYFLQNLDKNDKFYNKLLKFSFLIDSKNTFNNLNSYDGNKFDKNRINILKEIGLSLGKQLKLYLDKYSDTYTYDKSIWEKYLNQIIKLDFKNIIKELDELSKDKKKLSFLIPLLWENNKENFYPYLLKLSALNSKQVKEAVIKCLYGYKNGFEDFKLMIKSKKQGERIIGIELLSSLNNSELVTPLLNELFEKEKAKKVKDAINNYFLKIKQNKIKDRKNTVLAFSINQFNKEADEERDLNLENIKKISWLNIEELPKLYLNETNEEISKNLMCYLINRLEKSSNMVLFYEAEKLLTFIKKDNFKYFSKKLYEQWKDSNSHAEWVLILLSIYYNDMEILNELEEKLYVNIESNKIILSKLFTYSIIYIGQKRGLIKIARLLNKNYNPTIDAIYYDIGSKLNIGDILYDLRMKTFGFDENARKNIDYGTRNFTLTLTTDFKFTIIADNGKTYKNLPKPSKKDNISIANKAYENFKNMKKDLRDYLKTRKKYLEDKMISNVFWDLETWKFLFMENPIMNNLSKGLIWGLNSGKTFRIMDDNSLADIEDEEFGLLEDASISLTHPIDLSKEELELWKGQLDDYEITQPFEQLNRIVFSPTKEQLGDNMIDEFKGYMVMRISFRSKLMDKFGWNRGPAEDAGCYYSYNKYIGDIKSELEFMGECYGGYGDRFQEIWIGTLFFYNIITGKEINLRDIPKRQLSEIYLEIKSLADSGSGYNKDYLDTNW